MQHIYITDQILILQPLIPYKIHAIAKYNNNFKLYIRFSLTYASIIYFYQMFDSIFLVLKLK